MYFRPLLLALCTAFATSGCAFTVSSGPATAAQATPGTFYPPPPAPAAHAGSPAAVPATPVAVPATTPASGPGGGATASQPVARPTPTQPSTSPPTSPASGGLASLATRPQPKAEPKGPKPDWYVEHPPIVPEDRLDAQPKQKKSRTKKPPLIARY